MHTFNFTFPYAHTFSLYTMKLETLHVLHQQKLLYQLLQLLDISTLTIFGQFEVNLFHLLQDLSLI